MQELSIAKKTLIEGGYTCVLALGDKLITSRERGVAPLLSLIDKGVCVEGYCLADKVIGKAAAMLAVLAKIKAVYAVTLSESAVEVLERYGIEYSYDALTKSIINRSGTDICPMEKAVADVSSPTAAYKAICSKLKHMRG